MIDAALGGSEAESSEGADLTLTVDLAADARTGADDLSSAAKASLNASLRSLSETSKVEGEVLGAARTAIDAAAPTVKVDDLIRAAACAGAPVYGKARPSDDEVYRHHVAKHIIEDTILKVVF